MTLKTNQTMFEELLYPTFVAMSPLIILERHQKILDKYGLETFLKKEEFKRAREMYETARYAIGRTAQTGNLYWITPGKKNETPDTYVVGLDNKEKRFDIEYVEITQWEIHINDMWKIIEKKIRKSYPSHYSIIIHVSREEDHLEFRYFADINQRLKKHKISACAIRFWAEIKNRVDKDTLLGELYPCANFNFIEFKNLHILDKYISLSQQIIKIDVISKRSRITFKPEDFNNRLPSLPELHD